MPCMLIFYITQQYLDKCFGVCEYTDYLGFSIKKGAFMTDPKLFEIFSDYI
jgi:hypothetical protein